MRPFAIALLVAGVGAVVLGIVQTLGLPFVPRTAENAAIFGAGLFCAAAVLFAISEIQARVPADYYTERKFITEVIIFVAFALFALAGVTAGEIKFANAAITVLLGGIVLLLLAAAVEVIFAVVRMFNEGHRIEIQSQWGGLGGGLGGWQISQLAGMVLLAVMLIAGSLGALVALRGDAGISATETKPKGGTAPPPDAKPPGETSPAGKTNSKSG